MRTLEEFFKEYPKVALGFSGGVDSCYLLYAAKKFGAKVQPYYVKTAFQPAFELEDAKKIAEQLEIPLKIIYKDILAVEEVRKNPSNRCYYCKRQIFSTLLEEAQKDGYKVILDGTNASDDLSDRPGFKALKELEVLSPLREAGLTKDEIRLLSKEAGLFTWNKPSYSCLATRVPTDRMITEEILEKIEKGEEALFRLGFYGFRLRFLDGAAKLEIPIEQWEMVLEKRQTILSHLAPYFSNVYLDLVDRKDKE